MKLEITENSVNIIICTLGQAIAKTEVEMLRDDYKKAAAELIAAMPAHIRETEEELLVEVIEIWKR